MSGWIDVSNVYLWLFWSGLRECVPGSVPSAYEWSLSPYRFFPLCEWERGHWLLLLGSITMPARGGGGTRAVGKYSKRSTLKFEGLFSSASNPVLALPLSFCLLRSLLLIPLSTLYLILLSHHCCLKTCLCMCCVKTRAHFSALQLHCISVSSSTVAQIRAAKEVTWARMCVFLM